MLTPPGQVKIMDFGLARLADRSQLTKTDTRLGTPAYMSPEQVQGKDADQRSDIWSLGVVLYQMVSGRLPFAGEAEAAVTYGILNVQAEPVTALRSGVPIELDRILDKALAKAPEDRYQHVDELLVDLRALAKRNAAGGPSRVPPPPPDRRLRPGAMLVTFALGAIMAGGLAYLFTSRGTSPPAPNYSVRQVTFDPGLTYQPALSRDGNFLAYSSDRSGEGNLDIWVQQLGGSGEPIRLTNDPADDTEPHFSPDGRTIAFRSEREGGGVYLVPALGGDSRLLVKDGRQPRFSPDGSLVAYWVGPSSRAPIGEIGVVSAVGGEPRRLAVDFQAALYPIWSPGGTHLMFTGSRQAWADWDWWVASVEGGELTKTNFREVAGKHGFEKIGLEFPTPEAWSPDGQLFSPHRHWACPRTLQASGR